MDTIHKTLDTYVSVGDTLIVGVSGGPDSTALLRILVDYKKKVPLTIIVAHVNHGIRGNGALHDENFVKDLTKKYGLRFAVKRVKLFGQSGVEEKGRKIRRDFFEQLRKKNAGRYILTAHTRDDQIETVVFNFLRGSGVRGLSGMNILNDIYLRPLLQTPKKDLLAYLKKMRQPFCKDVTNNDTELSRNFIRKKILPLCEKINPSFRDALLRSSAIFTEVDTWLTTEAKAFLNSKLSFAIKEFKTLPVALKAAIIQEMYRKKSNAPYGLPSKNVTDVLRLIDRNIGKKKIVCSGGISFDLDMGMLTVRRLFTSN